MTLLLDLAPDTQQAIEREAKQRGMEPSAVAGEVLGSWARGKTVDGDRYTAEGGNTPLTPRQQAVMRCYGMLAGRDRTVDDFLRERREEARMEMRQAEQRDVSVPRV